ncbi:hypothetical protein [Arthrobacter sp. RIT-PI-e]|uniref:hypothetical protein n=1 Tax=Arthrobacter sp. RIT-PI-e TaxID=1681197 RepID=UPI000675C8EB|nr:hypothetical protein [Arthrobacter sp. RIT-PI-e]
MDDPGKEPLEALTGLIREAEAAAGSADRLEDVRLARRLEDAAERHLIRTVAVARAHGVPWQAIGDVYGISRQAAFKRFGTTPPDNPGADIVTRPLIDLQERTEQVFALLSTGDYAAVKAMMTFSTSRVLTKKKVMAVWDQVVSTSGAFESCSETRLQTADGRNVVLRHINQYLSGGLVGQTRLEHEAGDWVGRVAFNGTGKITGMLIVHPLEADNLPF